MNDIQLEMLSNRDYGYICWFFLFFSLISIKKKHQKQAEDAFHISGLKWAFVQVVVVIWVFNT